ncbi:unnamed protein product [Phytomonas sp. Hart1]|nr:unnamed protein product [Phytomonas sp. Hart1]|eukprot:CCW70800.1 unnamed protein product [Phytomonas sp. isolate Hart1]
MSFVSHYVPHSDVTKEHYEQLLLEIRRCLPPGVYDDLEEIAEEVLAIICVRGGGGGPSAAADTHHQQESLERLLGGPIRRGTFDAFLRFGRLITDYVAADATAPGGIANEEAENGVGKGGGIGGVTDNLVFDAEGPTSSTDEDDSEEDEIALLTGMPRRRRQEQKAKKKALKADKTLSQFAFNETAPGEEDNGGAFPFDPIHEEESVEGEVGGFETPKISFDEVACNPQYVKNTLRRLFPAQDLEECEAQANRVVAYLSEKSVDDYELETRLTAFLGGYDDDMVQSWIGDLRSSRWCIVYGLRYAACGNQKKKEAVMEDMSEHALQDPAVEHLYESITGKEVDFVRGHKLSRTDGGELGGDGEAGDGIGGSAAARRQPPLRKVDLQAASFSDEHTPHRHTRITVPHGTQRIVYETHDELVLPPTASHNRRGEAEETLVPLSAFPTWCHDAFRGVPHLNPMQSRVFECAFHSDENMLICAPTGAGKTNVAMMAMLRLIQRCLHGVEGDGRVGLRELKMVYVAPMKALVQEVVRTFSERLGPLGITVAELSGDAAMTQRQMAEVQLIVSTPEKWDIVTRKSVDLGVASLLKLIILDEVHLLHNERGPVLEAIVARTILQQQLRGSAGIRLVGLSATLPNYHDVAAFLQVDRQRGLFNFDSSYRPIPLQQSFCATRRLRGTNHAIVMNRIVYDKVLQAAQENEQVMIFVHSRRETEHTAMYLKQHAQEERHQHFFHRPGSAAELALKEAADATYHVLRQSIRQLLPHGFAIHHAGLSRDERQVTEELFAERHIKVLVCTSTLAWGVNLPANRVIIKGTRVFNASKGESERLSALDVLQMFGRAGRVGFGATVGHATIITSPEDLSYYLGLINQQLPVESQMMKRVVDMLNAEIALGHVENTKEGVRWLQRSYLYVRMLNAPELYSVRPNPSDPLLTLHLENIIHTACEELKVAHMVDYDKTTRKVGSTSYGRIASHCYVTTASMNAYLSNLSNAMQDTDLFRVFSLSSEFAGLTVRAEEQAQLKELLESVPIAVRESRYSPYAKINALLQCYISRKTLDGLPLMSEMVYVRDSAQRILRALYEISLVREFGRTARQFLQLYGMVLHQQWHVESPARQIACSGSGVKSMETLLPILERFRVPWEELRRWSLEDLVDKLGDERRAAMVHTCIAQVPHFTMEVAVRPLTRSMLYVDVDFTPDYVYNEALHGQSVSDLLLTIEHTNGRVLHHEPLRLPLVYHRNNEVYAVPPIVVPMVEPRPTYLFVHSICPQWLGSEAMVAVCLLNMQLPAVAPALREVGNQPPSVDDANELDVRNVLEPYKLGDVGDQIFPFTTFYSSQRDMVGSIFDNDQDNIFAGMPPGGGKTVIAELFILSFLLDGALHPEEDSTLKPNSGTDDGQATVPDPANGFARSSRVQRKVLYITTHKDTAVRHYMDWRYKFGELLQQRVVLLDDERVDGNDFATSTEIEKASIVIATGAGLISHVRAGAAWLSGVVHLIADHLHLLRAAEGRFSEECLARLQSGPFLVHHGIRRARLLALSYSLISSLEVGRWLRVPTAQQFNFGRSYRQLRVEMEGLEQGSARARYEAGVVAALKVLQRMPYVGAPCVVFVPHAHHAEAVARRVLLRCRDFIARDGVDGVGDSRLGRLLAAGVAYLHRGTTTLDLLTILEQVDQGSARHPDTQQYLPLILVCTFDAAWRLPAAGFSNAIVCSAERVITQSDDAAEDGSGLSIIDYADLSVSELLQMTSRASNSAIVFGRTSRRWVWAHLLNGPLPLESSLRYPGDFSDAVNAAVAQGRVRSHADVLRVLQSHYFLYHLKSNPHFYSVPSVEDLPLFASDLADRIVQGLQEQGCVRVEELHAADDSTSAAAVLHPTPRGIAFAHHCITIHSMQAVLEGLEGSDGGKSRSALTLADLLKTIIEHCEEVSVARLGDAVRITEAAELRALHTLARAIPTHFHIRYIDLDFTSPSIKVFLLSLVHCARFFAHPARRSGEVEDLVAHPFGGALAAATAEDLLLLRQIDPLIAARLEEDLYVVLPSVLRVLAGFVELLDGRRHAGHVASLMLLHQCLQRRVWAGEEALWQLPTVQRVGLGALLSPTPTSSSKDRDKIGGASLVELQMKLLGSSSDFTPAAGDEKHAALALAMVAEAHEIARIESFSARGGVEEVPGLGLAAVVEVCAFVWWLEEGASSSGPSPSIDNRGADDQNHPTDVNDDHTKEGGNSFSSSAMAQRWWLSCSARRKQSSDSAPDGVGSSREEHLLALRVSSLTASAHAVSSSLSFSQAPTGNFDPRIFELRGKLFFPLTLLEAEGDLDAIDLVARCTSMSYYNVKAETVVLFDDAE